MKTESYTGPFPRKRHSHRCEGCWKQRKQGAVYCYKSHCTRPARIESCELCRPAGAPIQAEPKTKKCRLCGSPAAPGFPLCDDCEARNRHHCDGCGEAEDECTCEDEGENSILAADPMQLSLFGGGCMIVRRSAEMSRWMDGAESRIAPSPGDQFRLMLTI